MARTSVIRFLKIVFFSLAFSLGAQGKYTKGDESWRHEMRRMKVLLDNLLPYTANDKKFNAPENAIPIDRYVRDLLSSVKNLGEGHQIGHEGIDPTATFLIRYFEINLNEVLKSNSRGRRDHSRLLVLNTTSYCIECHTRTKSNFKILRSKVPESLSFLNPVERVEYLISVREYEGALNLIIKSLKEEVSLPLFGAEKMVFYGLALTVKNFDSVKKTETLLEIARDSKQLPYFAKRDMEYWQSTLLDWKKEKIQDKIKGTFKRNKVESAQGLLEKAQELNIKNQSLHAGDVYVLRAHAQIVSAFAKSEVLPDEVAKALFLLGKCYQFLPENLFWALHEDFFEACIRIEPHSKQASQCFKNLEESVMFGFSGSSGARIPGEVLYRLNELGELSGKKEEDRNLF